MLHPEIQHAIEEIHATPYRLILEFAGAGSLALWWLHSVAGSSHTILEATDRYAPTALTNLLDEQPAVFVSTETAVAMAQRAYDRALKLRISADPVLGVGCTATIATNRPKQGDHRCVVAVWRARDVVTYGLTLTKGLRDRGAEEALVGQILIRAIVRGCDLDLQTPLELTIGEQLIEEQRAVSGDG